MAHDFQADLDAVTSIAAVPTILEVVCRTTGMGFATVARVTEGRWVACGVRDGIDFGLLPGSELAVETTICHEIRQSGDPVIINHVDADTAYCHHPTPARYGFQSYISMPIVLKSGAFFGTLCAIDPRPARLDTPEIIGMFRLFAELIAFHLDALERLATSESELSGERRTAELREQFIAVLGHDLRNPLGAIAGGAAMLLKTPLNDKATRIVRLMQGSVGRMSGLIDNVLDFARGRLGGGLTLHRTSAPLAPVLELIVAELQASWPGRDIRRKFDLAVPVDCDPARIAQLLSNLLANALTYGAADQPVVVRAVADGTQFEVSVANAGAPIPPATLKRLFEPFSRGKSRANQEGLGLGLYIASEIAAAHGGRLDVASSTDETRFTFHMKLQ